MGVVSCLADLANRGYTAGFYERHPDAEHQNYQTGLSQRGQSLYVGDLCRYDDSGRAEVDVKNLGDTIELIHPAGNLVVKIESMERIKVDGTVTPAHSAPGSGHIVRIALPPGKKALFLSV